jgi:hypothetical protein
MASTANMVLELMLPSAGGTGAAGATPYRSDANHTFGRLAGGHDLAVIIVAAMRADMMRAFQLAAIAAFSVRLGAERLMAAAHAGT